MKIFNLLLIASVSAIKLKDVIPNGDCPKDGFELSQKTIDVELDYFSRNFDKKHYDNAIKIYEELKKQGQDPEMKVHAWELYDKAFSRFERIRKYDQVTSYLDQIEHFQDNLNQNFTNQQHVDQFIKLCKAAEASFNEKYHDGEFEDPANYDPEAEHPDTWENINI